jgi:hypothetical protein
LEEAVAADEKSTPSSINSYAAAALSE